MALKKSDAPWTYEDLLTLPDDGKRYEIIEGTLHEMTGPNTAHATAIMNLILLLAPLIQGVGGRILTAPLDVFVPDSRATVVRRGIEGPPELIVEVISPSNRDHDVLTKRALYGRAGVREYWLVDPDARTFEVLTLDRDALHSHGTFADDAIVRSPLLDAAFPVAAVFVGIDADAGE